MVPPPRPLNPSNLTTHQTLSFGFSSNTIGPTHCSNWGYFWVRLQGIRVWFITLKVLMFI